MSDPTDSGELKEHGDDARQDLALQSIRDILWRFEEACEGRRSVYDVLGFLFEDLIHEGVCPACINELVTSVFNATGANPMQHKDEGPSGYH
ncbi:MAG: hypothetical protein HUJ31_06090 [Pseudomonadales bacterium]|nr:hypothetical protein [Pseudomonadales bacterium]